MQTAPQTLQTLCNLPCCDVVANPGFLTSELITALVANDHCVVV